MPNHPFTPWWQFWRPSSSFFGGLTFGIVLVILIYIFLG